MRATGKAIGLEHPNVVRYEPDLIEALHAAGNAAQARAVSDLLGQRAERVRSPWGLATAARCRGLLTSEDESEKEFRAALALHDLVPSAFERACTELCYRERLHRVRSHSDAREQLRQALATFDQLAADRWAQRARHEVRPPAPEPGNTATTPAADPLTPQELRVALIMADGATIQEAATQLLSAPKRSKRTSAAPIANSASATAPNSPPRSHAKKRPPYSCQLVKPQQNSQQQDPRAPPLALSIIRAGLSKELCGERRGKPVRRKE